MAIYGSHFEYDGVSSRMYSLIMANVNTLRLSQLNGINTSITKYSKKSHKRILVDDDYSESPLTFDIEIVTDSGRCLELVEQRAIEKWLFTHRNYRKLYFDIADDYHGKTYEFIDGVRYRNYLNCRFVNVERLEYNSGVVGYKATLEADSNMYWQDPITKNYVVNNGASDVSTTVLVNVKTDFDEYIYPKVTIRIGSSGGDITVVNNLDDSNRHTKFVDLPPHAVITMKGELNYVSGQYYDKFSGRNFVRLLDGANNFMVLGDIDSIEFEYSARRLM